MPPNNVCAIAFEALVADIADPRPKMVTLEGRHRSVKRSPVPELVGVIVEASISPTDLVMEIEALWVGAYAVALVARVRPLLCLLEERQKLGCTRARLPLVRSERHHLSSTEWRQCYSAGAAREGASHEGSAGRCKVVVAEDCAVGSSLRCGVGVRRGAVRTPETVVVIMVGPVINCKKI